MRERIHSVGLLESLLYLQSRPHQWVGADEVSAGLRTSAYAETQNLQALLGQSLIQERTGSGVEYQYAPANDALRVTVERLAEVYRLRRTALIDLIYARPPSPPSAAQGAARDFADAFNLKRRK